MWDPMVLCSGLLSPGNGGIQVSTCWTDSAMSLWEKEAWAPLWYAGLHPLICPFLWLASAAGCSKGKAFQDNASCSVGWFGELSSRRTTALVLGKYLPLITMAQQSSPSRSWKYSSFSHSLQWVLSLVSRHYLHLLVSLALENQVKAFFQQPRPVSMGMRGEGRKANAMHVKGEETEITQHFQSRFQ